MKPELAVSIYCGLPSLIVVASLGLTLLLRKKGYSAKPQSPHPPRYGTMVTAALKLGGKVVETSTDKSIKLQ